MNFEMAQQTILIVDDMPINIQVLARIFKDEYRIKVATSGEAALGIASVSPQPDVILLDIIMPAMDGYEVCKHLKENSKTKNIPIIFITSKSEAEDEAKGLDMGAADYISKPFSVPIVKARVKTQLKLKRKSDILESLVSLDPLTEIPNRRQFQDTLETEWKRAQRSSQPLSLVMADIDHFKKYNDAYGHTAGDECLKLVAQALNSSLQRAGDFVARYGGEEFVAVLPAHDAAKAAATGELMRSRVEALNIKHAENNAAECVTLSVGTATIIPSGEYTREGLIEAADEMLYKAKSAGRNRVMSTQLGMSER